MCTCVKSKYVVVFFSFYSRIEKKQITTFLSLFDRDNFVWNCSWRHITVFTGIILSNDDNECCHIHSVSTYCLFYLKFVKLVWQKMQFRRERNNNNNNIRRYLFIKKIEQNYRLFGYYYIFLASGFPSNPEI